MGRSHVDEIARSAQDVEDVAKILWSFGAAGWLREEGGVEVASKLWREAAQRVEEGHPISRMGAELLRECELMIFLQCQGLQLKEFSIGAQARMEKAKKSCSGVGENIILEKRGKAASNLDN